MEKLVTLKLSPGSLETGFSVILQMGEGNDWPVVEMVGTLPSAPELRHTYQRWRVAYGRIGLPYRLEPRKGGFATNVSRVEDCREVAQQLSEQFNQWLRAKSFLPLRDKLLEKLNPQDRVRFVVQTQQTIILQLPWSTWRIFESYSKAEIAFSAPSFERTHRQPATRKQIRVLAVLGHSEGIDIKTDQALLNRLPNAEVIFLVQPERQCLNAHLWEPEGWDILFFAGHSRTLSDSEVLGQVFINSTESLTIPELKHALRKSRERGLQVAIFNSCDGLGLAQSLADLQIPQVLVMREQVPDLVAHEFLKSFLEAFARGETFYLAVREAREKLQGLEKHFPCASWLPLIFQNPAVVPPTWQGLLKETKPQKSRWHQLRQISLSSLVITGLVMGIRWFGVLQPLELRMYDHMMQLRSGEVKPDPRLLIITIDQPDLDYQDREKMNRQGSLSDEALSLLLDQLEVLHPTTIGLDIYHQHRFAPALATRLRDNPFFTICKARSLDNEEDPYGVPPPQEIPPQSWGFSDILTDENDVVRRHLLTMTPEPTDPCSTRLSFSSLVALHYLAVKHDIAAELTAQGEWEINNVVLPKLTDRSGGYQGIDGRGYQILLNYRLYSSVNDVARSIPLEKVLSQGIPAHLASHLSEPIVIIGNTAQSYRDYFHTPYGEEIPGVFLQAQMISQILSTILDQRPLLWWWNPGIETFWVWGWSIWGGILAIFTRHPLRLSLNVIGTLVAIFGICFVVFSQAGWIPLVPPVLALVATTIAVYKLSTH